MNLKMFFLNKLVKKNEEVKKQKNIFQKGFTLIELIIVLVILGLLAGVVTSQFNPDSAKAKVLLTNSKQITDSLLRLKADIGCFPKELQGLFRNDTNSSVTSTPEAFFCATAQQKNQWKGPYSSALPQGVNTAGAVVQNTLSMDSAAAGANMEIFHTLDSSKYHFWYLRIMNLPDSIAQEYMTACLGFDKSDSRMANALTDGSPGDVPVKFDAGYKCVYKEDTSGTDSAQVFYLVQKSR